MKGYKTYWFAYRDLHLLLYKSKDHFRSNGAPEVAINLRGCEVTPEVNLQRGKFNIKLEVPPDDRIGPNSEMWIRCDNVSSTRDQDVCSRLHYQNLIFRKINTRNGWQPVVWHLKVVRLPTVHMNPKYRA